MSTPHNNAKKGEIASTVIMAGDPLRVKFIAENYLEGASCYNNVRAMYGYTGFYNGKRISVQGHGMGCPSMGIYAHELYNFYDVDKIIRVGTAGGIGADMQIRDIVLAMGACTNSNFVAQYDLPGTFAPIATYDLLRKADDIAKAKKIPVKIGNVFTSDSFYNEEVDAKKFAKMNVIAVEMEIAALYSVAAWFGKEALGILTIADLVGSHDGVTSAKEREESFTDMLKLALEVAHA
ncbi:MAG: purine-nucleoside phosphorylase [Ruminococcus sp.]|jgi:purine-nucleoside phosphorylase|nr:purine-nucleoside phosphorylase [Ruminococcus sp.]